MSDLRPPLKYTPEVVERLLATFKMIEEEEQRLNRRKAQLLQIVLGRPIPLCEICQRPLLTRRVWELIPVELRPRTITRIGTADQPLCFNHYTKKRVENGEINTKRLNEEELTKLRRAVGLE